MLQAIHAACNVPVLFDRNGKRGYRIKTYEKIGTEGGDYLCYHTMEKTAGGEG